MKKIVIYSFLALILMVKQAKCSTFSDSFETGEQKSTQTTKENRFRKDAVTKKIIPGIDGRIEVERTDVWPYSVHGVVFIKFPSTEPDSYSFGTGTLIGPNLVLTAAHNLYDNEKKEETIGVKFCPAINGKNLPFGEPRVIKYYFPEGYKTSKIDDFSLDYGLLVLDHPVGKEANYLSLRVISEAELKTKTINVTGYPSDKVIYKDRCHEMWTMAGPVRDIRNGMIYYEIDTYAGQAGGGVWYQEGEDCFVAGVHVGGDFKLGVNYAVLITQARYNQILYWIKDSILNTSSKSKFLINELFSNITDLSNQFMVDITERLFNDDRFLGLTKLDLSSKKIGDKGAQVLAKNKTLTELNLRSNNISDIGAQALAANNSLKVLYLENNNISDAGMAALRSNVRLKVDILEEQELAVNILKKHKAPLLTLIEENEGCIKTRSQKPIITGLKQNTSKISILGSAIKKHSSQKEVVTKRIKGYDARKQIKETNEWPNSVHGTVFIKFPSTEPDSYQWGTGTLIAPNLVLTAAHNLYDTNKKEEVIKVRFCPAINGKIPPFGEPKVIKYYFPESYKTSKEDDFSLDYGLLVLDHPIGKETGYFGLGIISEAHIRENTINVTGYPTDKEKDRSYEMWTMDGTAKDIKDNSIINYEIDTAPGQSGAGVWYKDGEDYFVVGVHVGGDSDLKINYAVLLTRARYDQITDWIRDSILNKISKGVIDKDIVDKLFTNLKTIDLSNQAIGDIGAGLFTSDRFPNLTKLSLSNNEISDIGAQVLARHTTITQLNLSSNNVSNIGAQFLAQNTTLTHLNLSENYIGTAGVEALRSSRRIILNIDGQKQKSSCIIQ